MSSSRKSKETFFSERIKTFILRHKFTLLFFLVLFIGVFLRFYNVENIQDYGWDQARDAWKVRDIFRGEIVFNGPRTGVGQFNLGPLWYYYLAPFYYFTHLDPIAAEYANIPVTIFNLIAVYWVTKKIYNGWASLFVSFIFAVSPYLIEVTRLPWNVTPVPGVSILIFYCIYEIVFKNRYKLMLLLAFLSGMFFHLHFSAVFLPPIILLSFLLVKNKKELLSWGMVSIPLYIVWLVPIVLWDFQSQGSNSSHFQNFLKDYGLGFHLRFLIHRLNDAFIQFRTVLGLPVEYPLLKFIFPAVFSLFFLFEKDRKKRLLIYLTMLWFVVPAVVYAFYGGSTSEYYVLMNAPLVLYVLAYLQEKLLKIKFVPILILLVIIWGFFLYRSKGYWLVSIKGGLARQKEVVRTEVASGGKYEFNEGEIKSYLYQIWYIDKR